ncbi:hypothetical protein PYCCODRAFT_142587 [Trametes coccinea BRFM310]|uniref:Uncharacterized protein n=1 Tax=Trametes coccinea (strain BRFM310) TaxID=1353009 RepID=A0A1Y2IVR2_TRAC3|nr:hypothetical protein PYCCODRAFT_142587 [Trametes coccinea BRFM310]
MYRERLGLSSCLAATYCLARFRSSAVRGDPHPTGAGRLHGMHRSYSCRHALLLMSCRENPVRPYVTMGRWPLGYLLSKYVASFGAKPVSAAERSANYTASGSLHGRILAIISPSAVGLPECQIAALGLRQRSSRKSQMRKTSTGIWGLPSTVPDLQGRTVRDSIRKLSPPVWSSACHTMPVTAPFLSGRKKRTSQERLSRNWRCASFYVAIFFFELSRGALNSRTSANISSFPYGYLANFSASSTEQVSPDSVNPVPWRCAYALYDKSMLVGSLVMLSIQLGVTRTPVGRRGLHLLTKADSHAARGPSSSRARVYILCRQRP